MNIKPFDEFLKTISDDDYNEMLIKATEAVNSRKDSTIATDMNDISLLQNIMLLRRYHEWLVEQL